MAESTLTIRSSTPRDTAALARLLTEIGHRTSEAELASRLTPILDHPDYWILVAEVDGEVVGMVGLIRGYFYERDGAYLRIAALVVDRRYRRQGIGTALVERAEARARSEGAVAVLLNTGRHRSDAHRFYRALGYQESGLRFHKLLE